MFLIKNNDKWNFLDTKDISRRSMFLDSKKKKNKRVEQEIFT